MQPTAEQQRIIDLVEGRHLVLAPPGTGKTDMLSHRVVQAMRRGILPEKMLCLTFTVRAALEMTERIGKYATGYRMPQAGNIHQICHNFLFGRRLVPQWWQVIDESTQDDLMSEVAREFDWDDVKTILNYREEVPLGELLVAATALYQKSLKFPDSVIRPLTDCEPYGKNPVLVQRIAKRYLAQKNALGVLDFDDLLTHTYRFLRSGDVVAPDDLHTWVQVDEAQDINPLQWGIIELLSAPNAHHVVFGDMEQAIFSFMGASLEELERLAANSTVHNLHRNFRSKSYLLDVFVSYTKSNFDARWRHLPVPAIHEKPQPDYLQLIKIPSTDYDRGVLEQNEAIAISSMLQRASQSSRLHDTAILVPTNSMADKVAAELERGGLPCYKVSGFDLFRRVEMRDFIALCSVVSNPTDRLAWSRIIKLFGKMTSQRRARLVSRSFFEAGLRPSDFLEDTLLSPTLTKLAVFRNAVSNQRIVVFDTETTGISTAVDDIIQIAAVEIVNGKRGKQFDIYINAERELGASEEIHKISRQTLIEKGVPSATGLAAFAEFAGDSDLVAHNASFDKKILEANLRRYAVEMELDRRNFFDTVDLARRIHPNLKSYSLEALIDDFGLEGENTHNAIDDVLATAELMLKLAADSTQKTDVQAAVLDRYEALIYRLKENCGPLWQRLVLDEKRKSDFQTEFEHFIDYCFDNKLYAEGDFSDDEDLHTEISGQPRAATAMITKRAAKFTRYADHKYSTLLASRPFTRVLEVKMREIRNFKEADIRLGDEPIVVTTIHKAKGMEFETVIVPRCDDNVFPNSFFAKNSKQIAEYARMLYVAITRSKKRLILLHSGPLSRFIQPLVSSFTKTDDV